MRSSGNVGRVLRLILEGGLRFFSWELCLEKL